MADKPPQGPVFAPGGVLTLPEAPAAAPAAEPASRAPVRDDSQRPNAGNRAKLEPPPAVGPIEAFTTGLSQGATFATFDEGEAAARTGFGAWGDPSAAMDENQRRVWAGQDQHPYISAIGEAIGVTPHMFWSRGGAASTYARAKMAERAARMAVPAYLTGTLYGAAKETGSPAERLVSGNIEGGISAGISAGIPVVGRIAGGLVNHFKARADRRAGVTGPRVDPNEMARDSQRFNIPITEGQLTGDVRQQIKEERWAHTDTGNMSSFRARQREGITAAQQDIQDVLLNGPTGPQGARRVDNAREAAEIGMAGLKERADNYYAEAMRAKDSATRQGTVLHPQGIDFAGSVRLRRDLPTASARYLEDAEFDFSPTSHPSAYRALDRLDELSSLADPVNGKGSPWGISLDEIERTRRDMNTILRSTSDPADKLGVSHVIRSLDAWVEDTIDRGLFTGGQYGNDLLQQYRRAYSQFRSLTNRSTKDRVRGRIAQFLDEGADPQSIANWIYGRSQIGGSQEPYQVIRELKGILGEDSPEWQALRQGMWLRIVGQGETQVLQNAGTQRLGNRIVDAVQGPGSGVAALMFTQTEREMMAQYGRFIQRLTPNPLATQPSKTSYRNTSSRVAGGVASAVRTASKIAAGLGLVVGSAGGATHLMGLGGAVPAVMGGVSLIAGGAGLTFNAVGKRIMSDQARRAQNPRLTQPIFTRGDAVEEWFRKNGGRLARTQVPVAVEQGQRAGVIPEARTLENTTPIAPDSMDFFATPGR